MTPPRLTEIECPACHRRQWIIDSDYRGATLVGGIELAYEQRPYMCGGCGRTDAGWSVKRQAPAEFLLQPHQLYPMTRADFDYWVAILRSNFPDYPRLAGLGTEFVPYTPEQAAADEDAKERNRPVDEMRLAGGGSKRFPGIQDAIVWLEAMKPDEILSFLRGDRGMLKVSKSADGTYAVCCTDARGHVLGEAAGIDGERTQHAVRRYLVGDVKRCLKAVCAPDHGRR